MAEKAAGKALHPMTTRPDPLTAPLHELGLAEKPGPNLEARARFVADKIVRGTWLCDRRNPKAYTEQQIARYVEQRWSDMALAIQRGHVDDDGNVTGKFFEDLAAENRAFEATLSDDERKDIEQDVERFRQRLKRQRRGDLG